MTHLPKWAGGSGLNVKVGQFYLTINSKALFSLWSFSATKNGALKTNIPLAMRVVKIALAYSEKPPMI